jgi:hypothetical protein
MRSNPQGINNPMKPRFNARWLWCLCFVIASALFVGLGCATPESNPASPRDDKGYADFYTDPPYDVYWKVQEFDGKASAPRVIYSEFKSPADGILRLALAPGTHHLRLAVLNLATEGPVEVQVPVTAQKVTPVRVRRETAGTTFVREVEDKMRHPGRRRKVTDVDNRVYKLTPEIRAAESYEPKAHMSYAQLDQS